MKLPSQAPWQAFRVAGEKIQELIAVANDACRIADQASPDALAVDILVNGTIGIEALPYREYTDYLPFPSGAQEIRVAVARRARRRYIFDPKSRSATPLQFDPDRPLAL